MRRTFLNLCATYVGHGSEMVEIYLGHVLDIYGTSLNMVGVCIGPCVGSVWDLFEKWLGLDWDQVGTLLGYVFDMFGACPGYAWAMFTTRLEHL